MAPSQNYFDLVEAFEGLRLTAYQDGAGIWTIGYGTTVYPNGQHVQEGDTCTEQQAQDYLTDHTAGIQLAGVIMQQEYDACLDFAYNAGQGAWNTSTLRKTVLAGVSTAGEAATVTANFCAWDKMHVNGQLVESNGLLRRRKCEAYLFVNGVNHPTFYE